MSAPEVESLVEDLFRREAGRLTAWLVRLFGPAHLFLAEDVVQETLLRALHQWPFQAVQVRARGLLPAA